MPFLILTKQSLLSLGAKERKVSIFYNHLGVALLERFSRSAKSEDLEEAISNLTRAINRPKDPIVFSCYNLAGYHKDIGDAYLARFDLTKTPEDLELAIKHHRHAADLCSDGLEHRINSQQAVRRSQSLFALASSLQRHFTEFNKSESLNEAVSILRTLVDQPKIALARANSEFLKPKPACYLNFYHQAHTAPTHPEQTSRQAAILAL